MVWQLKIGMGISATEVPPWVSRGLSLNQGSPTQGSSARKRRPYDTSLWKSSGDYIQVRQRAAGDLGDEGLQGPKHKLTFLWVQHGSSSSKNTRGIQGGTILTRARTERVGFMTSFSKDESAGRCHCAFIEPYTHTANQAQAATKYKLSISLAKSISPTR